jgi:hypothetical protein
MGAFVYKGNESGGESGKTDALVSQLVKIIPLWIHWYKNMWIWGFSMRNFFWYNSYQFYLEKGRETCLLELKRKSWSK